MNTTTQTRERHNPSDVCTSDYYPLTKISNYNPLWKMQAWCRRNEGTWYLYFDRNGNVKKYQCEQLGSDVYEVWKDGVCIFTTPFRLQIEFGVYTLVR